MVRSVTLLALVASAAVFAGACSPSPTPSPASPSVLGTIKTLTVSGTPPAVGSSSQFNAVATMSNGRVDDVTNSVKWQTSDATQATVSSSGVVSAIAAGSVTITATLGSVTATEQITIGSGS